MFRFHLLNIHLTLIYQVFGETENVRTDIFSPISLYESQRHMSNTYGIVFEYYSWLCLFSLGFDIVGL